MSAQPGQAAEPQTVGPPQSGKKMKYLLLARHSNPIINPAEEPINWPLSTIGKENAKIIADKIKTLFFIIS